MAYRDIVKDQSRESQSGFTVTKYRSYEAGDGNTLADMSLEKGQTLPEDADYEIIASEIKFLKPRSSKSGSYTGRVANVVAIKETVEAAPASGSYKWSELSGTRRILDSDPQTLRYEIKFTGAADVARPANGSTYAEVTGNSSGFDTTALDREPVSVSTSQVMKATTNKAHVTIVFQAHHARTTSGSVFTEINPRRLVRTGVRSWKGDRRFSATVAGAAALEQSLYNSLWPNKSGKYAPKCNRVETLDNFEPGRSLVVAHFETPRVIGEGKLRIEGSYEKVTRKEYPKGADGKEKYIIGPEKYKASGKGGTDVWGERRVVAGSNTYLKPMSTIILETAATSLNLNTFMNKVGHVNKYQMPNFGNAAPGTLLFLGLPHTTYKLVGDLWYINMAFKYSGDPSNPETPVWNKQTKSQLGTYVTRKMATVDQAGAVDVGSTSKMQIWVPQKVTADGALDGKDSELRTHMNFPESSFADLDKGLVITGI